MIIYNVTIKTDLEIAEDWLNWMKSEHLEEMMKTGLFLDYKMHKLLEQDETEGATFVVQYHCESMDQYQEYIDQHAHEMRTKGHQKFGNKFAGFRTIMEVIK